MRLIRATSERFVAQNEYRLPQYRRVRVSRRISLVEKLSTLPREAPNDSF